MGTSGTSGVLHTASDRASLSLLLWVTQLQTLDRDRNRPLPRGDGSEDQCDRWMGQLCLYRRLFVNDAVILEMVSESCM